MTKPRKIALLAVGVLAVLAAGIAIGVFVPDNIRESELSGSYSASDETREASRSQRDTIRPEDFTLEAVVTMRNCVGGKCLVNYEVRPSFNRPVNDLRGRQLMVIYDVIGGEDPEVGNFTTSDTRFEVDKTASIWMLDSSAAPEIVVTRVMER